MLQVGCGSVGLIFPCAIIGAAKHAVATTKNRKFFIWTSSLVSVLANVSEKEMRVYIPAGAIESNLRSQISALRWVFVQFQNFFRSRMYGPILRLSSPSGNAVLLCATMFSCAAETRERVGVDTCSSDVVESTSLCDGRASN